MTTVFGLFLLLRHPLCAFTTIARHLAADVADLAFQIADAGFARVVLDQFLQCRRR